MARTKLADQGLIALGSNPSERPDSVSLTLGLRATTDVLASLASVRDGEDSVWLATFTSERPSPDGLTDAEYQMALHVWRQKRELASNYLKALHDMEMTPIRNIR